MGARLACVLASNQHHPIIQTLLPNIYAIFQDDNTLISWFEDHADELQHLSWPTRSLNLYIIGSL